MSDSSSLFQTWYYRPSSQTRGSYPIMMTATVPGVVALSLVFLSGQFLALPPLVLHYIGQVDGWRDESSYHYCYRIAYCFIFLLGMFVFQFRLSSFSMFFLLLFLHSHLYQLFFNLV
jgi:hypothetical protein